MDCTIPVAKTKALISFAVTAKLICVFVFANAKSLFSHDMAQISRVLESDQSSLCFLRCSFLHADSEDSDQTRNKVRI